MKINEIFTSIDGESRRAGELSTFVRSNGCNLKCDYCDSKYTWENEFVDMTTDEIVDKCAELGALNITFTGGEPLIQKDADELIIKFANRGFDVCIETNGSVDFTNRKWYNEYYNNVWVCADYKCYESHETDKMLPIETFAKLRPNDVLKFVVGSQKDLELAKDIILKLRREYDCSCYIYISPVFGKIEPEDIVKFMMDNKLQYKIRFQLQLHKFIWDPNKRGV